MNISVELPAMLVELTGLPNVIEVECDTILETLAGLLKLHPMLELHLFNESGELRRHILCSLNDEIIPGGLDTRVFPGDHLALVHAVASG